MKYLMPALRLIFFMMLLLGLAYPFLMTGLSQVIFPEQASGQFISRGGTVVGSLLIGQNFEKPEYFWSRPSAVGHNPQPSGGSNLGQASAALKATVEERRARLKSAHAEKSVEPPSELLFASASGLDPHISPEAASYQSDRVAKARGMSVDQVQMLVKANTNRRQLGIMGEPVVNVLALNLALDKAQNIEMAPTLKVPVGSENK